MLWCRLASLIGTIRTRIMGETEHYPLGLRQSAAAAVAVAAVAAALPVISHRAAEQRADAEWSARSAAFQMALQMPANPAEGSPAALLKLASVETRDGLRARAQGALQTDGRHAMIIAAMVRDQHALAGLEAFQPAVLEKGKDYARQQRCLAEAVYYEARGESFVGQLAVAEVVRNRVHSRHYPDTFCDVVYEGSWRSTGCQFTFTCDGSLRSGPRGESWAQANLVAGQVLMGLTRPLTHRATHYHTDEVDPVWSASLVETTRIGAHIFYRFPSARERVALETAKTVRQPQPEDVMDDVAALTAAPVVQPVAMKTASLSGLTDGPAL